MKRSPPRLQLRRETLRVLASIELTRVVGGDPALPADTGAVCTDQAAPKPPGG